MELLEDVARCPACKHVGQPIGNMRLTACQNERCRIVLFKLKDPKKGFASAEELKRKG